MLTPRIRSALIALVASAGLAGCASIGPYGGIGVGVSSGYGGYGGYGYDPYYAGYGYGSAYGYNRYGWYNGYYYPGSGHWVYDRDRKRRQLTPAERAYWNERIREYVRNKRGLSGTTATAAAKEDWSGFSRPSGTTSATGNAAAGQADQGSVRQTVEARRQARADRQQSQQQARGERQQARSERQESARQEVQERRQSRRATRSGDD